jgi:RNA polymerase sigma-70 factor (ECF subfamily)
LGDTPSSGGDEHARDGMLVARIRAGDRGAFDELVIMYCDPLCHFAAATVGNVAEAEELVQELFLNIWRMRGAWEIRSNLRSYLFSGVHKLALNHCRRARLVERWEGQVAVGAHSACMAQPSELPDRRLEGLEFRAALTQVIQQLPPRRRQIAALRFVHGLTCPEIARIVGGTAKAAELHAAKALRTIRAALAVHWDR